MIADEQSTKPLLTGDIERPELWRLAIKIEPGAMHVVLHSTVEDGSLITRRIPLDAGDEIAVQSFEEAVYDNPLLMARFARISVEVVCPVYAVIPSALADDEGARAVLAQFYPQADFIDNIIINHIEGLGASVAMAPPEPLVAFLRRTFDNPAIIHPLAALASYFMVKSRLGNSQKMFAHCDGQRLNVIAFSRQGLTLANTYTMNSADDAAYYLLAVRKALGMSAVDDELQLAGDATTREAVANTMRQYHQRVMPVIFPSAMFQAGRQALAAPFDLIILPLL